MKTYMTAKKKKKKKNNNEITSSWAPGLQTWAVGCLEEGFSKDLVRLRFYGGFTTCSGGYIILSIISLEILSWILGVIESSGRLFFNIPLKKKG